MLLTFLDCPKYTPCVIQDNVMNHDLPEHNEEENIKVLCHTMVVMLGPLVISSPCELNDALNIETNPKGIMSNSFCQKDVLCFSLIHHFEMLYVSPVNLCMLFNICLI